MPTHFRTRLYEEPETRALRFARQFSPRLKVNFRGAVQELADLVSES